MYLKSKKIAFLGLLTAMSVVLLVISGVIEFSTLFFLALAAFCVGIAINEVGMSLGSGLFVASLVLGLLLAPNKMYCITYSAFSVYIIAIEGTIRLVEKKIAEFPKRRRIVTALKYVWFNALYLPILFFLPKLIYQGELTSLLYVVAIFGGQIIFYIFDRVYFSFMDYYIRELRKRLKINE